jgi:hypothetical protein
MITLKRQAIFRPVSSGNPEPSSCGITELLLMCVLVLITSHPTFYIHCFTQSAIVDYGDSKERRHGARITPQGERPVPALEGLDLDA